MAHPDRKPGEAYDLVTFDDATEYFQDKQKNKICEVCSSNTWAIPDYREAEVVGIVSQSTETFSINSVVPIIILECANCGNMKFFRESRIRTYLNAKMGVGEDVEK